VVTNILGAGMRAVLVWLLIATPSLLLPGNAGEDSQLIIFFAVLAAFFTFVEYYSNYPLSLVCQGKTDPTELTLTVKHWGDMIGQTIDVPYSPVRLGEPAAF